jgi:hypothetical protein
MWFGWGHDEHSSDILLAWMFLVGVVISGF